MFSASSAGVERAFSTSGNIATALRNRLSDSSIDSASWLHDNIPVLEELTDVQRLSQLVPPPPRGTRTRWGSVKRKDVQ